MGGVYKPLEKLCGKPVLSYSLGIFQKSPYVKQIIIAAREDKTDEIHGLVLKEGFDKVKYVISGGESRQDSVEKAFRKVFSTKESITKLVAVHDAARPLLTQKDAEKAFGLAKKYGSAVCASRVRDTVKRTDAAGVVSESVDRDGLWLIQTPQVFDTDIFHTALSVAKKDGFSATDDGSLVDAAGFKVLLSEASAFNIKLTYPEDMLFASALLSSRKQTEEE